MSTFEMRYDRYSNAIYIKIAKGTPHLTESFGRGDSVNVNVDKDGEVLGVEILIPGKIVVPPELEEEARGG